MSIEKFLEKSALFSPDGKYRYRLTRVWDREKKRVCFIMLNPSTADSEVSDPTVSRCIDFADRWGYGSISVVNLFALRSTDPWELYKVEDPVGPDNDEAISTAIKNSDLVVAAWGVMGKHKRRDFEVRKKVVSQKNAVYCIKKTRRGDPAHPLYLPAILKPSLYLGELENG